jgi:hypothetical protein
MLIGSDDPTYEQIAADLGISQSTAHAGVARLRKAGLLLPGREKRTDRLALLEFIEHGLRYVFPATLGATRLGIPTAHSGPVLAAFIDAGDEPYVWPSREGTVRGRSVEPLLPKMDQVARRSPELYASLSLVDALRVGRARERELASRELRSRFNVPSEMPAP